MKNENEKEIERLKDDITRLKIEQYIDNWYTEKFVERCAKRGFHFQEESNIETFLSKIDTCLIQQASASCEQVKTHWKSREFLFDSCLIYKILQVKVKAL